jgi:hypothetical protein
MAKHSGRGGKSRSNVQDLAVVAVANDWEQAAEYEALLKNEEIPVMVKKRAEEPGGEKAIVVMVPEEFVDEAHVVIESHQAYEDFYDLTLEDEQENGFEGDFLDDDY